jgi:hypothetical protein
LDKKRTCKVGTSQEKGIIPISDAGLEYAIENNEDQKTAIFKHLCFEFCSELYLSLTVDCGYFDY